MSPATPNFERIAFVAGPSPEAREAFERLAARYGNVPPETATSSSRSAATGSCCRPCTGS